MRTDYARCGETLSFRASSQSLLLPALVAPLRENPGLPLVAESEPRNKGWVSSPLVGPQRYRGCGLGPLRVPPASVGSLLSDLPH